MWRHLARLRLLLVCLISLYPLQYGLFYILNARHFMDITILRTYKCIVISMHAVEMRSFKNIFLICPPLEIIPSLRMCDNISSLVKISTRINLLTKENLIDNLFTCFWMGTLKQSLLDSFPYGLI